jgi:molybdate transport system substrate-binding protein
MTRTWFAVAISSLLLIASGNSIAGATEIKVLSAVALRPVLTELVPQFERSSGHKLTIEYGAAGMIADRVQKGEVADATITPVAQIEDLQKQGKIVAGSRTDIASVGVGVFVRAGAPKPVIGSVDAFKRVLLASNSVSYGDPAAGGVSGVHMTSVVERLGIATEMKPRHGCRPPVAAC